MTELFANSVMKRSPLFSVSSVVDLRPTGRASRLPLAPVSKLPYAFAASNEALATSTRATQRLYMADLLGQARGAAFSTVRTVLADSAAVTVGDRCSRTRRKAQTRLAGWTAGMLRAELRCLGAELPAAKGKPALIAAVKAARAAAGAD